jgi:hypothetical protein
MVLEPSVAGLFKWRQFEPEMILLAVGWYLRFSLSYRDVEELLAERGLLVDHVTVWRWVQQYRYSEEWQWVHPPGCPGGLSRFRSESHKTLELFIMGTLKLDKASVQFILARRRRIVTLARIPRHPKSHRLPQCQRLKS